MTNPFTLAAKCAPEEKILEQIERAGIRAVELYTDPDCLHRITEIRKTCSLFPFRYAVHAPHEGFEPERLAALCEAVNAEVLVCHDIYWEDEWQKMAEGFAKTRTGICIENIWGVHDPVKFERRFGFFRCLDLEHLQMECGGVFEDFFCRIMKRSRHIHMTGYSFGTDLWHTPLHHNRGHNRRLLGLLRKSGYAGFVVSEAETVYQTYEEFFRLKQFFENPDD